MAELTDKQRAERARVFTQHIADSLRETGYTIDEHSPLDSGNVEGGWIINATDSEGEDLHIEVCPSCWEDDGTYDE